MLKIAEQGLLWGWFEMHNLDKINIFVPAQVKEQIEADNSLFGILKKDGHTINRNSFISMVLVGYYDSFVCEENEHAMSSAIGQPLLSSGIKRLGKGAVAIPYKPTKKTDDLITHIKYELEDESHLPRYLARLLISYCEKPISERERIVFKDKYDLLIECCRMKQPVFFTTGSQKVSKHTVLPYDIVVGREELFNFLLCQEVNPKTTKLEAHAYRLNRLDTVSRSNGAIELDNAIVSYLEKMKKYGAQYEINDDEQICVRVNETGWRLFNTGIYFGKPILEKYEREGEAYLLYFICSKNQVELYFRRFGKDAEVIYPETLRQRMIQFYENALMTYKEGDN